MNQYTLYSFFKSSASWRVRIVMNLIGQPYQFKYINLDRQQHKNDEYKKIHPNLKVPALRTPSGDFLFESMAIIQYLNQKHPQIALLSKDSIQRAHIRGFCQIINSAMQPYQIRTIRTKIKEDYGGDDIKWSNFWVMRGFQVMEDMLKRSKGKYSFGDKITLADVFLVPQVQGGLTKFKANLLQFPNINQVYKNLKIQKAFIDAQPENQKDYVKQTNVL